MKDKKSKEEVEAEKFRKAIYLLAIFILLFVFSSIISHFFGKGSGIEKCKAIILQNFREDCFQKVAAETGNISICNLTLNKYECLTRIAILQRNISICNVVGKDCVALVVNLVNESECIKLNPDLKDYCLFKKAMNSTNGSLCNQITNFTLQELCKKTIFQSQLSTSKNFSICENLSGFGKLICLEIVARNLNLSTIPSEYVSGFNYSLPSLNISESELNKLTENLKNLSLIYTAISTKNLSICANLPRNQSFACYFLYAFNSTNISVCNYLPQELANTCKQMVTFYITRGRI
jgi:hypothetical protein